MFAIYLLTVFSALIILFGILMIFSPSILISMANRLNKIVVFPDIAILTHRWFWGTLFVLAGIYLVYGACYSL